MLRRGLKTAYYQSLMHIDHYLKNADQCRVTTQFGGAVDRDVLSWPLAVLSLAFRYCKIFLWRAIIDLS